MPARGPYSALLLVGLAMPVRLPVPRWAFTPPFHPCRGFEKRCGGLFSVALSLGLPRPGVTRHHCLMESGLSSDPGSAVARPSAQRRHSLRSTRGQQEGKKDGGPAPLLACGQFTPRDIFRAKRRVKKGLRAPLCSSNILGVRRGTRRGGDAPDQAHADGVSHPQREAKGRRSFDRRAGAFRRPAAGASLSVTCPSRACARRTGPACQSPD